MNKLTGLPHTCLMLIILFQLCCSSNSIAGIYDRIGGSGNNDTTQSSGNSNTSRTLLYVAGGIAAAFIAWTIISDKPEEKELDTDSTEAN